MNKLVANIKEIKNSGSIKTTFYNITEKGIQEVTEELFKAIKQYNEECKKSSVYMQVIPYNFKNGVITYSYGCGLTHYLQKDKFAHLQNYVNTFDLKNAELIVLTPSDMKMLRDNLKDENIIYDYYVSK